MKKKARGEESPELVIEREETKFWLCGQGNAQVMYNPIWKFVVCRTTKERKRNKFDVNSIFWFSFFVFLFKSSFNVIELFFSLKFSVANEIKSKSIFLINQTTFMLKKLDIKHFKIWKLARRTSDTNSHRNKASTTTKIYRCNIKKYVKN